MHFSLSFAYFADELVVYNIRAMKRIILHTLSISLISICAVACGLIFPHPKSNSVVNNHTHIIFANETERVIIVEHNLAGTEVCEEVAPSARMVIISDFVYLTKKYDGTIEGDLYGATGYEIGGNFGREYIGNYAYGSYVRIYDANHYLIREWYMDSYDPLLRNPFDVQYYEYDSTRSTPPDVTRWEQAEEVNEYVWTFYIDESLLSAE